VDGRYGDTLVLIIGRPYPLQVYQFACSYCSSNPGIGQRGAAAATREKREIVHMPIVGVTSVLPDVIGEIIKSARLQIGALRRVLAYVTPHEADTYTEELKELETSLLALRVMIHSLFSLCKKRRCGITMDWELYGKIRALHVNRVRDRQIAKALGIDRTVVRKYRGADVTSDDRVIMQRKAPSGKFFT